MRGGVEQGPVSPRPKPHPDRRGPSTAGRRSRSSSADGGTTLDASPRSRLAERVGATGARLVELAAGVLAKVTTPSRPQPPSAVVAGGAPRRSRAVLADGPPRCRCSCWWTCPRIRATPARSALGRARRAAASSSRRLGRSLPPKTLHRGPLGVPVPVVDGDSSPVVLRRRGRRRVAARRPVAQWGRCPSNRPSLAAPSRSFSAGEAHGLPEGLHPPLAGWSPSDGRPGRSLTCHAGTLIVLRVRPPSLTRTELGHDRLSCDSDTRSHNDPRDWGVGPKNLVGRLFCSRWQAVRHGR